MPRVNFSGSFYTIKDLSESQPGNFELLAELSFEENAREFIVQQTLVTKGHKPGELHVYMLIENEILGQGLFSIRAGGMSDPFSR